jgi:uncharacterized repeat protein (TIGR04076 family)
MSGDEFRLYDLKVEWVAGDKPCYCKAKHGDHFTLEGEIMRLPPGQGWSIYTLAGLLPHLPARQRETHPNDWMSTDEMIACPDPNCGARFRIVRTGLRTFRHGEVTAVPVARPRGRASGEAKLRHKRAKRAS